MCFSMVQQVTLLAQYRCRSPEGMLLHKRRLVAPFRTCHPGSARKGGVKQRQHVCAQAAQVAAAPVQQAAAETYLLTGSAGSKVGHMHTDLLQSMLCN